jgi:hypothetical protein
MSDKRCPCHTFAYTTCCNTVSLYCTSVRTHPSKGEGRQKDKDTATDTDKTARAAASTYQAKVVMLSPRLLHRRGKGKHKLPNSVRALAPSVHQVLGELAAFLHPPSVHRSLLRLQHVLHVGAALMPSCSCISFIVSRPFGC